MSALKLIEDLSGDACDFDNVKWIGKGHKYCICNQGDAGKESPH